MLNKYIVFSVFCKSLLKWNVLLNLTKSPKGLVAMFCVLSVRSAELRKVEGYAPA